MATHLEYSNSLKMELDSYLREAQPTTLEELAAITALYRPGPMGMGLHQDFAKRKQDESARIPVHRAFYGTRIEEILKGTLNSLVFQEQVIKIATDCAGFTSKEADKLRKAMGKKDAKNTCYVRKLSS